MLGTGPFDGRSCSTSLSLAVATALRVWLRAAREHSNVCPVFKCGLQALDPLARKGRHEVPESGRAYDRKGQRMVRSSASKSIVDRQHPRIQREAPLRRLKCVSSGHLADNCSCSATVPTGVVHAAWERQLAHAKVSGDRFFRIAWQGRVWLAYGLGDGGVRGVYCPTHTSQRDENARRDHARDSSHGLASVS